MRRLIPFLLVVLLLWGWVVFFDQVAKFFIFVPAHDSLALKIPMKEVSFTTKTGEKLQALYSPSERGKPTILFFHGNKYNIYYFQDFARPLLKEGYGLFLFDYRGYGKSEGKPSCKKIQEDGIAALTYLMKTHKILPKEIVLWGFSLGNAPMLHVANQYQKLPFKAVLLQSPFTNLSEMGLFMITHNYNTPLKKGLLPLLKFLLWNKKLDNTQNLPHIKAPILIGYSRQDELIPWEMSRELAHWAPQKSLQYFSPTGEHHSFDWFTPKALQFIEGLDSQKESFGAKKNPLSKQTAPKGKKV